MSKEYLEALNEIIDKFAEQMMRANKEKLTAVNKTNAIEYLYRTPQVRLLQQALIKAQQQEKEIDRLENQCLDFVADNFRLEKVLVLVNELISKYCTIELTDKINCQIDVKVKGCGHTFVIVCTEEEFDLLKRYCDEEK